MHNESERRQLKSLPIVQFQLYHTLKKAKPWRQKKDQQMSETGERRNAWFLQSNELLYDIMVERGHRSKPMKVQHQKVNHNITKTPE